MEPALGVDKVAALRENEDFIFSECRFSCDAAHHGQKICKEAVPPLLEPAKPVLRITNEGGGAEALPVADEARRSRHPKRRIATGREQGDY